MQGVENPVQHAWGQSGSFMNEISSATHVPIVQNDNWKISIGICPFSVGFSGSIMYNDGGDWSGGISGGFGVFGGSISGRISHNIDQNWRISAGAGMGRNHWGIQAGATYRDFGLSYGQTFYRNTVDIGAGGRLHPQNVGNLSLLAPGGSFRIENDFLAFNGQDRWRTSAWELTVGDWSIGSSVFTNDPRGMENVAIGDRVDLLGTNLQGRLNRHGNGAWRFGNVYFAPLWIGHRVGNTMSRIGYSCRRVQCRTQNWVHRNGFLHLPFGRTHYFNRYGRMHEGWYGFSGIYNPFSLFNR